MSPTGRARYDADVIILSWNRTDDVLAAVESALEQNGVTRCIQIVDQGSEPKNIEKLDQFVRGKPEIALKRLAKNSGVAGGRNIATAMGSGRYVVALDSDAVFADSGALARAVDHLDSHPELGAIGFRIENYFTGKNDELSWDYPGRHPDEQFHTTRFIGAGHALRRAAFKAAGGYDPRLFFCQEELDLCYRMLNLGYRIEYLPDVKVRHKVSPDHRIAWDRGRYFFTVRNALYTSYKFGVPLPRLVVAAMAFLARGAFNGVPGLAVRGLGAAIQLCARYARSPEDKSLYRLSADTWRYIEACEPWRNDRLLIKIRRQFSKLPHNS
jgi:GT2 family glycosyltransferase